MEPDGRPQALVAWSGGKDAFLAMGQALRERRVRMAGLLTTFTEATGRTTMHGVRRELIEAQARMLGLPLTVVELPDACTNEVYEARMGAAMQGARDQGVTHVVHGDIALEDVRAYRDARLAQAGMTGLYPLWGQDTTALARHFVAGGHRAIVCCVDGEALDPSFAGHTYDQEFVDALPAGVDPCGENGEFHTFVHESPVFRAPVPLRVGGVSSPDGRFHRADLVPGSESMAPPRHGDTCGVALFEDPWR